jgi:hypothetical protein
MTRSIPARPAIFDYRWPNRPRYSPATERRGFVRPAVVEMGSFVRALPMAIGRSRADEETQT